MISLKFNEFLELGMGESRTMNMIYKFRDVKASNVYEMEDQMLVCLVLLKFQVL